MKIKYSSNNSGGDWWLSDKNWFDLEKAGWVVNWVKNDAYRQKHDPDKERWLGALATSATIEASSIDDAIEKWEDITGQYADDQGCPCCGQPHYFYEVNDDDD